MGLAVCSQEQTTGKMQLILLSALLLHLAASATGFVTKDTNSMLERARNGQEHYNSPRLSHSKDTKQLPVSLGTTDRLRSVFHHIQQRRVSDKRHILKKGKTATPKNVISFVESASLFRKTDCNKNGKNNFNCAYRRNLESSSSDRKMTETETKLLGGGDQNGVTPRITAEGNPRLPYKKQAWTVNTHTRGLPQEGVFPEITYRNKKHNFISPRHILSDNFYGDNEDNVPVRREISGRENVTSGEESGVGSGAADMLPPGETTNNDYSGGGPVDSDSSGAGNGPSDGDGLSNGNVSYKYAYALELWVGAAGACALMIVLVFATSLFVTLRAKQRQGRIAFPVLGDYKSRLPLCKLHM